MSEGALLKLFKEQLEKESEKIGSERDLSKRGDFFIWWYFKAIKGYSEEKILEIICDGGGDLGIDVVDINESNVVHFYQFKHPQALEKDIDGTDIDKLISGLHFITKGDYSSVANQELKERLDEIKQAIPSGYVVHVVTSSIAKISVESSKKMDTLIDSLGGTKVISWTVEDLAKTHDVFYSKNLPTIENTIYLELVSAPYPVKSSGHESFLFHLDGVSLAKLYQEHGELLLKQNIRVSEGKNATNNAIETTCVSTESGNFYHYNNGITFLCEEAPFDPFTKKIGLIKAQIVNGGQTIRVLHKAYVEKKLRDDVTVVTRVITSKGDKEFANNVAVNLNNQTRVESSFLKSNDPNVIQLANSMLSYGYYLERREDEVAQLSKSEVKEIEKKIGATLSERVIPLKEGAQSYVALFMKKPELAKKNVQKIFMEKNDGGVFEDVFDVNLTAQRFLFSFLFVKAVEEFVSDFAKLKRRKNRGLEGWEQEYKKFLGSSLYDKYHLFIDQVIPQSTIFLSSLIFTRYKNSSLENILENVKPPFKYQIETLVDILESQTGEYKGRSWPTLLKSQAFFDHILKSTYGQIKLPIN